MADLAEVFFGGQLGKEVTPGTAVASDKLMQSFGFDRLVGQGDGTMFRPQGSKLNTIAVPTGMRMVNIPFKGVMTYNELVYLLVSAVNSTTPSSDGTNGKLWTFTLTKSAADTKQTYTFMQGNSIHAQKATFAQVTSLSMEMSKSMNAVSGAFTAQQIQDDITITASPTEITPIIVTPLSFDVYNATAQSGLAGASVFGRPIKATFSIDNIVAPLFRMNSSDSSYVAQIEQAPNIRFKITTDADDAGMAFLTNMTAGSTTFWRVKSLGAVIAGAIPSQYLFQLDVACQLVKHYAPTAESGAALAEWDFDVVYDSTWTKAFAITCTNVLAAI